MLFKLFTQRNNYRFTQPKYFLTKDEAHAEGCDDVVETYGYYHPERKVLMEVNFSGRVDYHSEFNDVNCRALRGLKNGFYDGILTWVTEGDTEYYAGKTTYFLSVEPLNQYCSGTSRSLIHIQNNVIEYFSYGKEFKFNLQQFVDAKKNAEALIEAENIRQRKAEAGRRQAGLMSHVKSEMSGMGGLTAEEFKKLQESIDAQCAQIIAARK